MQGEARRAMEFHRPSGSTRQVEAVSAPGGCGPSVRLLCRVGLENIHISCAFAPRIRADGLTPFRHEQVLTLDVAVSWRTYGHSQRHAALFDRGGGDLPDHDRPSSDPAEDPRQGG